MNENILKATVDQTEYHQNMNNDSVDNQIVGVWPSADNVT